MKIFSHKIIITHTPRARAHTPHYTRMIFCIILVCMYKKIIRKITLTVFFTKSEIVIRLHNILFISYIRLLHVYMMS